MWRRRKRREEREGRKFYMEARAIDWGGDRGKNCGHVRGAVSSTYFLLLLALPY